MSQFIIRLVKLRTNEVDEAFMNVEVPDDAKLGELTADDLAPFVSDWGDPESEPEERLQLENIEETDHGSPPLRFTRDDSGKLVLVTPLPDWCKQAI